MDSKPVICYQYYISNMEGKQSNKDKTPIFQKKDDAKKKELIEKQKAEEMEVEEMEEDTEMEEETEEETEKEEKKKGGMKKEEKRKGGVKKERRNRATNDAEASSSSSTRRLGKRWFPYEERALENELSSGKSFEEIARAHERTQSSIQHHIEQKKKKKHLPYPIRKGENWSEYEDRQLINELKDRLSIKRIAILHQRTERAIATRCMQHAVCGLMQGDDLNSITKFYRVSMTRLNSESTKYSLEEKKLSSGLLDFHDYINIPYNTSVYL